MRPYWFPAVKVAVVVAVFLFAVLVIDPFSPSLDQEEATAARWIRAIGRLGIEPIYPPQEDFHVGDIWAVVSRIDPSSLAVDTNTNETLVGRGVRIGHIDLAPDIASMVRTPVFSETTLKDDGSVSLLQETVENPLPAANGVRLSLSSFPVIDVDQTASASASIMSYVGFRAGRDRSNTQHIAIPKVETYGAPVIEAFARLSQWCRSEKNRLRCDDAFIRKLLSYTVDPRVLEVEKGQYTHTLQIQIVTQVYMTREIDVASNVGGKVLLGLSDQAVARPGESGAPAQSPPVDTAAAEPPKRLVSLDLDEAAGLKIGLRNMIYQRPLVFGFKVISLEVSKSAPQREATP